MAGHLQQGSSGHLLCGNVGHLSNEATDPPSSCPSGLSDLYRIVDISALVACPTCISECENVRPWDGHFAVAISIAPCVWHAQNRDGFGESENECLQVNSVDLAISSLSLDSTPSRWSISINCNETDGIDSIWFGEKSTGLTPAGFYTRISGCSTVQLLQVVSVN